MTTGAGLRSLEPWHAEEFLVHIDRGRDFITEHIPCGAGATDVGSAREILQSYADRCAADNGSLHGLWLDGKPSGRALPRLRRGGRHLRGRLPARARRDRAGADHTCDAGACRLGD
ncbi:hypothetical protein GCM10022206_63540 [Streptomyces chiangmaiensis]